MNCELIDSLLYFDNIPRVYLLMLLCWHNGPRGEFLEVPCLAGPLMFRANAGRLRTNAGRFRTNAGRLNSRAN